MDHKLNIKSISPTWSCCSYQFVVAIKNLGYPFEEHHKYVEQKLTEFFGSCRYFWNDCYLCGKK